MALMHTFVQLRSIKSSERRNCVFTPNNASRKKQQKMGSVKIACDNFHPLLKLKICHLENGINFEFRSQLEPTFYSTFPLNLKKVAKQQWCCILLDFFQVGD